MVKHTTAQLNRLRFSILISQMKQFVRDLAAEDFSYVSRDMSQRVAYKRRHAPRKIKGGKPPKEFQLIEDYVDLQLHLKRGEYYEAIPLYYKLKRMLNR